jgi:hypothetical protein
MKNLFLLFISIATLAIAGCNSVAHYPIDEKPQIPIDYRLVGIWKMEEDTNKHNYFVIEKLDDYQYNMTYMNQDGNNRGYEHWRGSISNINNAKFINIPYSDWPDGNNHGLIFMKINNIEKEGWTMSGAFVNDSGLKNCKSSAEVRKRIADNMDKNSYFSKELHFERLFALSYCPDMVTPIMH